jgi:hypothetical protein
VWRLLIYLWAGPTTLPGLFIAALTLLTGGTLRRHTGVLEIWGGAATWLLTRLVPLPGGALAMTLGHVVLAQSADAHEITRRHERVHVRQVERWGPLFLPAYGLATLIAALQGRRPYRDNLFEVEAYDQENHRPVDG